MERKTRKLIGRPEVPRTGIGAILTKHRKAKGWTLAQLAEVIGIDRRQSPKLKEETVTFRWADSWKSPRCYR